MCECCPYSNVFTHPVQKNDFLNTHFGGTNLDNKVLFYQSSFAMKRPRIIKGCLFYQRDENVEYNFWNDEDH